MRIVLVVLLLVIVLFSLAGAASAVSYLIQPDGSGDFPTIQEAIDAAAAGDTILLADGTFVGAGNHNISYRGKSITVRSAQGLPGECAINCYGGAYRGFLFIDGESSGALLEGVTIRGTNLGMIDDDGGAVLCAGTASPTVRNCYFYENNALRGGVVACLGFSAPRFEECHFITNTAFGTGAGSGQGAALYCGESASPAFHRCEFHDNRSYHSGAIHAEDSSHPILEWCTLSENGAWLIGSAIRLDDATAEVRNCTIVNNYVMEQPTTVIWCTGTSFLSMERSIVAFSDYACAIGCNPDADALLTCCDLYGNWANWIGCVADQLGVDGNFSEDPLFCGAANPAEPFSLHIGSPCLPGQDFRHRDGAVCGLIGAWPVGCPASSVDEDWVSHDGFFIVDVAPNPASSSVRIAYHVPVSAVGELVVLSILDVGGRRIREFKDSGASAGESSICWDGTGAEGERVAAGVYFCRLSYGTERDVRTILLMP